MKPLVKGWELSPPIGGWSLSYSLNEKQSWMLTGGAYMIVQQIAEIQKRNDVYEGDQQIWDYCNKIWCDRDPKRCQIGTRHDMKIQPSVLTFAHALKALVKNGLKPVSEQLAEKRARICAYDCKGKQNRKVTHCSTCLKTVSLITKALIGRRKTKYDSQLKQCGVCKCDLKQKIHYPLNDGDTNQYPNHCWVTKEKKELNE